MKSLVIKCQHFLVHIEEIITDQKHDQAEYYGMISLKTEFPTDGKSSNDGLLLQLPEGKFNTE